ncbi:MAG: hypothetical protein ACLQVY_06525 [Limisphaerales bacterium]
MKISDTKYAHRCLVIAICAALVLDGGLARGEGLHPVRLLCEGQESPLGIDGAPRLGWILESDHRAENQTGYQVQVASSAVALQAGHADMWNSGKILSDQSSFIRYGGPSGQTTLVPYAGKPLKSHSWYFWRVRIWDGQDHASEWSQTGRWATGVLRPDEWRGAWIASSGNSGASVWFRSTFELKNGQQASAVCSIASSATTNCMSMAGRSGTT